MHEPVGYVGDADFWCEDCARDRFNNLEGEDHEGNEIGALFTWSESGDTPDVCGGCHATLNTSWSPEAVRYVLELVREVMARERERSGLLDEWVEHLEWCGINDEEIALTSLYFTY